MTEANNATPRILVVVPTLGRRLEFLDHTLRSIASQSTSTDIVLVVPKNSHEAVDLGTTYGAFIVDDPGGLSAAINAGVSARTGPYDFVSWLGDDDLLLPGSLASTSAALDRTPEAVLAFGHCHYIDGKGRHLGTSRAGRIAPWLLIWGPDLVPQPGMLVRRTEWLAVGGLDESLSYAMDLDLLLRLRRRGRLLAVDRPVACFRWHPESLTVSGRSLSSAEAEVVKRRYLPALARRSSWLWERPVRMASAQAARGITRRAIKAKADGRDIDPRHDAGASAR